MPTKRPIPPSLATTSSTFSSGSPVSLPSTNPSPATNTANNAALAALSSALTAAFTAADVTTLANANEYSDLVTSLLNGTLFTTAEMDIYVRAIGGNDANPGTMDLPLATLGAAFAKIPCFVNHRIIIHVGSHVGDGYAWTTIEPRLLGENIYIYADGANASSGKDILVASSTVLAGSSASVIKCNNTIDGCQGATIEILTGASTGDRRTIKLPISSNQYYSFIAVSGDGVTHLAGIWNGPLIVSTDSGTTWIDTGLGVAQWSCGDVSTDGTVMYAGSLCGRLYKFTGAAWTETQPAGDTDVNWRFIKCNLTGEHAITGVSIGRLYTTSNTGASWTERKPAGDRAGNWQCGAIDADGSFAMAGENGGRLWISVNTFVDWTEKQPSGNINNNWHCADCSNTGSNLIVAADFGRLYTSTNTGTNWTERKPAGDVAVSWRDVSSDSNGTNLFAIGYYDHVSDGFLYGTADSGANWRNLTPGSGIERKLSSIASNVNATLITASIWNGLLYSSVDVGTNWIEYASTIRDIFPVSPFTDSIAPGDLFQIFKPAIRIKFPEIYQDEAFANSLGNPNSKNSTQVSCNNDKTKGLWLINFAINTYGPISLCNSNIYLMGCVSISDWGTAFQGEGSLSLGGECYFYDSESGLFGYGTPSPYRDGLGLISPLSWSGWGYTDDCLPDGSTCFYEAVSVVGYIVEKDHIHYGYGSPSIVLLGGCAIRIKPQTFLEGDTWGAIIGNNGSEFTIIADTTTPFQFGPRPNSDSGLCTVNNLTMDNVVMIGTIGQKVAWANMGGCCLIVGDGQVNLGRVIGIADQFGIWAVNNAKVYWMGTPKISGLYADIAIGVSDAVPYHSNSELEVGSKLYGDINSNRDVQVERLK